MVQVWFRLVRILHCTNFNSIIHVHGTCALIIISRCGMVPSNKPGECVFLSSLIIMFLKMAESCSLTTVCISFCYKVSPQNVDVIISLLRAKGTLTTFEAMGIGVSPLAMEMIASTSCLTTLALCGVTALTDDTIELVRKVCFVGYIYRYLVLAYKWDDLYQICYECICIIHDMGSMGL